MVMPSAMVSQSEGKGRHLVQPPSQPKTVIPHLLPHICQDIACMRCCQRQRDAEVAHATKQLQRADGPGAAPGAHHSAYLLQPWSLV